MLAQGEQHPTVDGNSCTGLCAKAVKEVKATSTLQQLKQQKGYIEYPFKHLIPTGSTFLKGRHNRDGRASLSQAS